MKTMLKLSGLVVLLLASAALVFTTGCSSDNSTRNAARFGVASVHAAEPIGHIGTGKCAEAVEKAGGADKYVYALFYRESNDQLAKARSLVESARKKVSRKSELVEINITDQSEQDIVAKFGANRAPMPLILILAPNGAVMGGFPTMQLTDDARLVDAVGCKASEQTMKALQQKNMVLLCCQGKSTKENDGAMRGVEEFVKDAKYSPTTAVVTIDPSDPAAAKFLTQVGMDPKASVATTALLAPPGSVAGTFQGALTKDKLVAAVQAAATPKGGCCPGGSSKGCAPTPGK